MILQTIRSHNDAYDVAHALSKAPVGTTVHFNLIDITTLGDEKLEAKGMSTNEYYGRTEVFMSCELADLVLWPERKRINDGIRTHYQR